MQGMEEAAQKQSQELQAVDVELKGCHKDIKKAAMRTEQTNAVLERLQGEAAMLSESSTTLRSRQGMLQVFLLRSVGITTKYCQSAHILVCLTEYGNSIQVGASIMWLELPMLMTQTTCSQVLHAVKCFVHSMDITKYACAAWKKM